MRAGALMLTALLAAPGVRAVEVSDYPLLAGLRDKLVAEAVYPRAELDALLADIRLDPRVTEALSKPAERLPWHRYRPIFVTPERAAQGVAFWRRHAAALRRAQETYGVPAHVVTAIIGVETRYGTHAGRHRVLDALATLGLSEHPRSAFFFGQLEALLRLVREERLDPRGLVGSYAGAMGIPQFIPSSYRAFAVDFDGDGRRDLLGSPADAIGSVGHYLAAHGWAPGAPVVVPARLRGEATALPVSLELDHTLAELEQAGALADSPLPLDPHSRAVLVTLEGERGPEYRLGLQNFYAITRYNRSPLYAMAVYELSEAIEAGVAPGL